MSLPPVVCIIGKKNSGKTTLAVRLVEALVARGHRVMTAKHGHQFDLDTPGTDSWRHRHEGGAARVALVAPHEMAVMGEWSRTGEPSLAEVVENFLGDADLVIAEGFKQEGFPAIEVYRRAEHASSIYEDTRKADRYLAMVADTQLDVPFPLLDVSDPQVVEKLIPLIESRLPQD